MKSCVACDSLKKKGGLRRNSTRFEGAGAMLGSGKFHNVHCDSLHTTRLKKQSVNTCVDPSVPNLKKRTMFILISRLEETFTYDPSKMDL